MQENLKKIYVSLLDYKLKHIFKKFIKFLFMVI